MFCCFLGADHSKSEDMEAGNNSLALKHNTDEKYMAVMKPLQFGKIVYITFREL